MGDGSRNQRDEESGGAGAREREEDVAGRKLSFQGLSATRGTRFFISYISSGILRYATIVRRDAYSTR